MKRKNIISIVMVVLIVFTSLTLTSCKQNRNAITYDDILCSIKNNGYTNAYIGVSPYSASRQAIFLHNNDNTFVGTFENEKTATKNLCIYNIPSKSYELAEIINAIIDPYDKSANTDGYTVVSELYETLYDDTSENNSYTHNQIVYIACTEDKSLMIGII